jgi:hypothetical protein
MTYYFVEDVWEQSIDDYIREDIWYYIVEDIWGYPEDDFVDKKKKNFIILCVKENSRPPTRWFKNILFFHDNSI